jgi:DNA-binding MarR family transcriptional regulator
VHTSLTGTDVRDGVDADYGADLIAALIAAFKRVASLRSRLPGTGQYDMSQTHLLIRLADLGPTRAGELADKVCADPSTVSRQVAALVRAGLVERRADPEDGRASLLVATPAGLDQIAWHRRIRSAAIGPLIADWTPQEREIFLRLLTELTRGLDVHRDTIIATLLAHTPNGTD